MTNWKTDELALLWRHTNEQLSELSELTGRSVEEVGDMRLKANIERNGWDVNDPEREEA